jgi:S-methylmethionine-dependent homocysteine/selenocysteine methylase
MTKQEISNKAKVLIEMSLEGIFEELQDEYSVSGDITPAHQEQLDNAIESMSDLIASNVLFNLNNEPQEERNL